MRPEQRNVTATHDARNALGLQPPREKAPDVVFYTGCNVLKTPHIALLCLDIFDLLGVDYEVMGGVGQCCGVYQYRAGDFENNS